MKRTFCLIAAVLLLFSSCQTKRALLTRDYYREEALLENIAQAIETNNVDGLLSVFSVQAKTDSAVMEDEIRQFMIDFSDEEITWKDNGLSSRSYDYDGTVLEETMASYDLYAGDVKYTAFLIWWSSYDRVEREDLQARLGVYTLRIVEENDYAEQYEQLHYSRMEIPGVYYKPTRLYENNRHKSVAF